MFSACLRSNYYCSPRAATKKLWFLASSLPTNTAQELFSLRRILSNTFTAHSHSTLPDPSQSSSSSSKRRTRKKDVNRSFTVSYLVDSCGLSPAAATRASQMVHFATPEKPDSVLSLLRNHGFTKTQVAILVRQYPKLLVADAEKTLLPKFQFYQSIGFSETNLAETVTYSPNFLRLSLKNQIIPTCKFLKTVVRSDEKVCLVLRRLQRNSIGKPFTKFLVPNVALLRKLTVPETSVVSLLTNYPEAVAQSPEEFSETVSRVAKMGFNPSKFVFVKAVIAFSGESNRALWDRCYKTYTKWGWSNDEILLAFKKQPQCMLISEKKITGIMEFLVNYMGWHSREIAAAPDIVTCSLEKKIIPRCSVIRLLSLNGLLKKKYKVNTVVKGGEKSFIKMFVTKYEAQVPGLMSFYQWMLSSQKTHPTPNPMAPTAHQQGSQQGGRSVS